jgi:hypothetical protein
MQCAEAIFPKNENQEEQNKTHRSHCHGLIQRNLATRQRNARDAHGAAGAGIGRIQRGQVHKAVHAQRATLLLRCAVAIAIAIVRVVGRVVSQRHGQHGAVGRKRVLFDSARQLDLERRLPIAQRRGVRLRDGAARQ